MRMRSGDDFTRTVRRGARVGTPTVVVHGWRDPQADQGPLVGFVVSKAIGNAVTRNRVRRRLRHLVREHLTELPTNALLVVRALPAASQRPARLPQDFGQAWSRLVRRWQPGVEDPNLMGLPR
ncbi:ribonuclease P protein component [Microlunatus elymi]|uniref:Ribonuclease P protein component n=2 Tax=Microlunatus elymi TaxID=2596828 RepID=A0A516PUC5_9ACTN|nr:ribonuclease P protein component [Microlunatus elymi]